MYLKIFYSSKNLSKGKVSERHYFLNIGIEEYEKNTLNYLSEFINSYIIDVLSDSKNFAMFSDHSKISVEDVK